MRIIGEGRSYMGGPRNNEFAVPGSRPWGQGSS
jgi:hypothetical protein